jgi:hypothetical protein
VRRNAGALLKEGGGAQAAAELVLPAPLWRSAICKCTVSCNTDEMSAT